LYPELSRYRTQYFAALFNTGGLPLVGGAVGVANFFVELAAV
jgi:hypothetical protein